MCHFPQQRSHCWTYNICFYQKRFVILDCKEMSFDGFEYYIPISWGIEFYLPITHISYRALFAFQQNEKMHGLLSTQRYDLLFQNNSSKLNVKNKTFDHS